MRNIIFGPPGTGKTTRLMKVTEDELSAGVGSKEIAFLSFTKKAIAEAKDRAAERFSLSKDDMPWFRTIHSLAYYTAGVSSDDVMSSKHFKELSRLTGTPITPGKKFTEDGLVLGNQKGDALIHLDGLSRSRMETLHTTYQRECPDLMFMELRQFSQAYRRYKSERGLYDFTDMLQLAVEIGEMPIVKVGIVDEAQDLTPLQWKLVNKLLGNVERCYIAGDPDQALYQWNGADPYHLIEIGGQDGYEVLEQSWRVPKAIHRVAIEVIDRCYKGYSKTYLPLGEDGMVEYMPELSAIDFKQEGSWYVLGRNSYMLDHAEESIRAQGLLYTRGHSSSINPHHTVAIIDWEQLRRGRAIPLENVKHVYDHIKVRTGIKSGYKARLNDAPDEDYDIDQLTESYGVLISTPWYEALDKIPQEDREYYRGVMRRGNKLTSEPQIHLSTIHGVKGGEADNVVLMTDMAYRSYQGMERDPDQEHRVFYVAVTRAKKRLIIIQPQGRFYYEL